MPFTAEIIKANPVLASLTDEVVNAVIELGNNQLKVDVKKEIDTQTGEIYRRFDEDIKSITGKERPEKVKTYEFMKSVLEEYKTTAEKAGNSDDLKRAKEEVENLKKQIAEGTADAVLKKKLETTEQLVRDMEAQNKKLQGKVGELSKAQEDALKAKDQEFVKMKTDFAFAQALQGVKFRSVYPEAAATELVNSSKAAILQEYVPELVKGSDGKETIQFRHKETGEIALNPANFQNPYSPAELLLTRLKKVDLIDEGRKQGGAGTNGGSAGGGGGTGVSLDGVRAAKTRVQADEAILDYLKSQQISTSHPEFNNKFQELRKEHKVSELPPQ